MLRRRRGLIGWLTRFRKLGTIVVLIVMAPFLVGCFGYFPLTRAVYEFNNAVPTGILRNLVFWLFLIVPVYGTTTAIDMIVLNLLEFWLPGHWGDPGVTHLDVEGQDVVLTPSEDGREALLSVSQDGKTVLELRLVKVSEDLLEVRDVEGKLLGTATRTESGDVALADGAGKVLDHIDGAQLAAFAGM